MWTIEDTEFIYGLKRGDLFFLVVDEQGDLCLSFYNKIISFRTIIEQVATVSDGRISSFVLRLPQMITDRIRLLQEKFAEIAEMVSFNGKFTPIFPIKVNPLATYIQTVLESDSHYGLEVGSKTEFETGQKIVTAYKPRLIVCNGYKDKEYLELARTAYAQGHEIIFSIESVNEARLIAEELSPGKLPLGLRIKPYVRTSGRWAHSAGRESKFGFSIADLQTVIDILLSSGHHKDVVAINAHAGSQLADSQLFREYIRFMTGMFAWLRDCGLLKLSAIDFGGGIPIDYTSLRTKSPIDEYLTSLIETLANSTNELRLEPQPDIIIEAGRAITAQSSLTLVKILDIRKSTYDKDHEPLDTDDLQRWVEQVERLKTCEDLEKLRKALLQDMSLGVKTGNNLVSKEALYSKIKATIRARLFKQGYKCSEPELVNWAVFPDVMAVGDFSVFNSVMDHLLVQQYFPVLPISGLDSRPETTIRLVDRTCDSDGEISNFVKRVHPLGKSLFTTDGRPLTGVRDEVVTGVPVPDVERLRGSYLVIALTGAYQDSWQTSPALFAPLPDVTLTITSEGEVKIEVDSDKPLSFSGST